MSTHFSNVALADNYYQTSSFYPMPVVLISTYAESGAINLAPYSLVFPHFITGKGEWALLLACRGTSNTAENIRRTKICTINFIPHKRKYMKNCVQLGFPGEKTEAKMKHNRFTLVPSAHNGDQTTHPPYVEESIQIVECTWDDSYPLKHNEDLVENHFVLHIDNIKMKDKWKKRLQKGKGFPCMPINFGFRDNVRFWFAKHCRPYYLTIPKDKGNSFEVVKYACDRYDPNIRWEKESIEKILKVPNIFLKTVIGGTVKAAKESGLDVITPEFMDKVRKKGNRTPAFFDSRLQTPKNAVIKCFDASLGTGETVFPTAFERDIRLD